MDMICDTAFIESIFFMSSRCSRNSMYYGIIKDRVVYCPPPASFCVVYKFGKESFNMC